MDLSQMIGFAVLGAVVGVLSGMLGIGGAILIIPMLVLVFGFDQKMAVGTSLAMLLPPIGIFAVLQYHKANQIHVPAAAIMAVLFALGAWLGSYLVTKAFINERALRIFFCIFLLYTVANMLFRTEQRVWSALVAVFLTIVYGLAYIALRALGKRMERNWSTSQLYQRRLTQSVPIDYEI